MTAFRDQLALDVGSTFLNAEEFGEAVVIDGVTVTAVRDDDLVTARTMGPRTAEGIDARRRVLSLASGQIPLPSQGARLDVDGTRWYVEQVSEAEGMIEITLVRQVG